MKKIAFLFMPTLLSIFAVSCEKSAVEIAENLTVNPENLVISPEGETKTFTVLSNQAWIAQCDNWITLSTKSEPASDVEVTVAASVARNSEMDTRTGSIKILLKSGNFKEITVTQDPYEAPAGIYSAQDLQAFANAIAQADGTENDPDLSAWATEDGIVRIYNDIDAGSLECFPIPLFPSGYILDGQGHTINLAISSTATKVGIFKDFRGTAKNLKINGSVMVEGQLEAETHIGTLASNSQFAALENCENNTTITINVSNTSKLCTIAGGFIGKATSGLTVTNCTNNGSITFTSAEASSGAYHMLGGIVGAYGGSSDGGVLKLSDCINTGSFNCNSGDQGNWNYVAGLVGNIQNSALVPTPDGDWAAIADNCSASGDFTIEGKAKTRVGGVMGRFNSCGKITNCSYSGTITLNAANLERNVGGITSYQEKTSQTLIENCIFSGKILSDIGATSAYYLSGIVSSGCSALTVIKNCKTTKDVEIQNHKLGNISMIVIPAREMNIENCKVAGKFNIEGTETIISAKNYDNWMCGGYSTDYTSLNVNFIDCGYNAE